jgi:hypothetical protein
MLAYGWTSILTRWNYCLKTCIIVMDNLYKSKKKANATSINTSDVPHPNVSPLAPKSIRLNCKNMFHQWNNNKTTCTKLHAYPLARSMLNITLTHCVDIDNIVQSHCFTCDQMQKKFNPFKITSKYILGRSFLAYFRKHLKQKDVFENVIK